MTRRKVWNEGYICLKGKIYRGTTDSLLRFKGKTIEIQRDQESGVLEAYSLKSKYICALVDVTGNAPAVSNVLRISS
jgi:hypothetical protein